MDTEELIEALLQNVSQIDGVLSCSRIDDEPAIGIELEDGGEFFLTVARA